MARRRLPSESRDNRGRFADDAAVADAAGAHAGIEVSPAAYRSAARLPVPNGAERTERPERGERGDRPEFPIRGCTHDPKRPLR